MVLVRIIMRLGGCTLLGPPAKSQLSGPSYSAYQKQPTGGCTNEEVARYEAHTFGDGGSRTYGGDGSYGLFTEVPRRGGQVAILPSFQTGASYPQHTTCLRLGGKSCR